MSNSFDEYYSGLSKDEKLRIDGAIPFLLLLVADADNNISLHEVVSFTSSLLATWKAFGDNNIKYFLDGQKIETQMEQINTAIKKRKEEIFFEEVKKIGDLLNRMPDELQSQYKEFISTSCIKMASASGASFWDKKKISDEEKIVLNKIKNYLGIS